MARRRARPCPRLGGRGAPRPPPRRAPRSRASRSGDRAPSSRAGRLHSALIASRYSSVRAPRSDIGTPTAVISGSRYPAATPRSSRPPLSTSRLATSVSAGPTVALAFSPVTPSSIGTHLQSMGGGDAKRPLTAAPMRAIVRAKRATRPRPALIAFGYGLPCPGPPCVCAECRSATLKSRCGIGGLSVRAGMPTRVESRSA
jgi:hypothetical protein